MVEGFSSDVGRNCFVGCKRKFELNSSIKTQSLLDFQILSLPSVFASLGMVAGIFLVIGLGAIATITGYMIGSFKLRYPHVHNMADAGEILAGPIGREVLGAAQVIFIVFLCGSHVLTGTIAFDTSE